MNGQDKSYVKPGVSSIRPYERPPVASPASAVASLGTPGGSNGAPSGAVASNSWIKDMMMMNDHMRAVQTGISSRAADNVNVPSLDVMSHFTAQYSAAAAAAAGLHSPFSFYPGIVPTMQPIDHGHMGASSSSKPTSATASTVTSSHAALTGQMLQPDQLSKAASAIPRFHHHSNLEATPPGSSNPGCVSATAMKHSMSARLPDTSTTEPHAKRQKPNGGTPATVSDQIPHTVAAAAASALPQTSLQTKECTESSIPHRPSYFMKGSIIQLGDNKLKRIEDLETGDFEDSAQLSPNLCIDCSTVINIKEEPHRGTAFLTFSIGDHLHDQVDATVEATLEHPFFVFGQGWSSVCPERTLSYYQLSCQQLKVMDRCISLTFKDGTAQSLNEPVTQLESKQKKQ